MSLMTGTRTSSVRSLVQPIVTIRKSLSLSKSGTPHWKPSGLLSTSGFKYASVTACDGNAGGRNNLVACARRNFFRKEECESTSLERECSWTSDHQALNSSSPVSEGNSERI